MTSPYETLPAEIKKFVDNLARTKNLHLSDNVTVLSLIGTRGRQPPWNDRRRSVGHAGIPLASADFISALPMIARLLTDLGVEIKWSERPERGFSAIHPGYSGLFYVPDARTSQDQYQRHIIPAQDFVAKEDVRTVFGVGGSYTTGTLFAMIFFSQKAMSREAALRYLPLVTMFKAITSAHVEAGRIFAS